MDPHVIEFELKRPNSNTTLFFYNKLVFIFLVISETIYFIYFIRCTTRFRTTKDWKFLFPLTAALFAFMNNFNDILHIIFAPTNPTNNCQSLFLQVFKITALFNWTPISFVQILRLYHLTKGYYTPYWHRAITIISVSLSILYCTAYYYNLAGFNGSKNKFYGCSVYNVNNGIRSYMIELTDTLDSSYSLVIIIISIKKALQESRHYKLRHQKLKALKDESMIIFIVLTVSKILIYSLIMAHKKDPGGDIYWDILSVIVIACSYRIVNFKPKMKERIEENNQIIMLNKRLNYMNMQNMKNENGEEEGGNEIVMEDQGCSTNVTRNLDLYKPNEDEYNLLNIYYNNSKFDKKRDSSSSHSNCKDSQGKLNLSANKKEKEINYEDTLNKNLSPILGMDDYSDTTSNNDKNKSNNKNE